jgi:Ca-activated chloride channel family protein
MEPTIRLNHNVLAVESEHTVHVMVELSAPEAATDSDRAPLKLALVIDRSGSMAGEKLEATKASAAYLVRRLGPADELAVVVYDDSVDTVAPLAPVDTAELLPAIAAIWPGGSTNLSGGWLKGLEMVKGSASTSSGELDATRPVLLLTDGQANVGITEPGALVGMVTTARGEGVGTTTIGFGDGFAEALLTGMADAGGGNAHFAPTPDAAPAIFADEFEGLASVVAQNVSVEIRPSDEVGDPRGHESVPGHARVGRSAVGPRRRLRRRAQVAGVRSARSSRRRPRCRQGGRHRTALRERGRRDRNPRGHSSGVVNVATEAEADQAEADNVVIEEVIVLKAAQARDEARRLADSGDFAGGQALLRASAEELRRTAPDSAKAAELLSEADRLEETSAMLAASTYDASTQKQLHYDAYQSRRKRDRRS